MQANGNVLDFGRALDQAFEDLADASSNQLLIIA
jgi:hypothetical protein